MFRNIFLNKLMLESIISGEVGKKWACPHLIERCFSPKKNFSWRFPPFIFRFNLISVSHSNKIAPTPLIFRLNYRYMLNIMHHASVWKLFPPLPWRGGGKHMTKLCEKGWRRISMRGDYYCLQKTDYSGLQRVLQNFTEGYII